MASLRVKLAHSKGTADVAFGSILLQKSVERGLEA